MTTRTYAPFGELANWAGAGGTGLPSEDKGYIPLSGIACRNTLPRRWENATTQTRACST